MWKFKVILFGFLGILFLGGLTEVFAVGVTADTKMRTVSGKISWIDVKLGSFQLKADAGQDTRGIMEYTTNQDETRVTDPTDTKFLVIKDLRVGQHVTIELIDNLGETMARKIIAEPLPEPVYQEAVGVLKSIDVGAGTLVIEQKPLGEESGKVNLSYYVFEPKDIVIMEKPNTQPVQLVLNPGDLIKVEFLVKDSKQYVRSITLLQAVMENKSTTTTTITRTTVTE
jgi:hypothetical protein